jgi:hypothetical protein
MPLSRLENFLKNAEGNILYVNPSDFDATDSIENRGNSLTRPFRTIQRAVIEAARFSYVVGRNNDKIDSTTILVYPGVHYIDNRPGHSITNQGGTAEFRRYVNGVWTTTGATLTEFTENSNFDIFDEDNDLHKYNSVDGGVILPRGTSIVGLDLRKTKLRPMYVPDPLNDSVERSAIFRVTGTCYFTSFTIFDADPQRACYKDSTGRKVVPNYSHHKLTAFEYADGVNEVILGAHGPTGLTDLEMFYYKVTYAYGDTSGRGIPNYPVNNISDFEPSVDEFRIVGDLRADPIGITSIKAGNGLVPTTTVTVTTSTAHGLFKDTPVLVSGITTSVDEYNGSFLVSDVLSDTVFQYVAPSTPVIALPSSTQILNARTIVESDSVSSASPYIFACTLRSVYGMNGLHADGSKATGFKSMLTAQFTGISLQKDDNAFILYDKTTGIYNENLTVAESEKPLHTNSRSIYKPDWENVHMKCSNNSIIQCVSIFAIGYAKHFVAESGGDQSITNSNSNFGAVSLEAVGFRPESFDRDDVGYITHVIPPRELIYRETNVTWLPLDVSKIISAATTSRLYIAGYESKTVPPPSQIDSYRIGAKEGEELNLNIILGAQQSNFRAPILMQVPSGIGTSSKKTFVVGRAIGINSISSNIITLTSNHTFFNGEKVRVTSDNGDLPENLSADKIYYVNTTSLSANQIKLASTLNDSSSGNTITGISNGGGRLEITSFVSDKSPGEVGHPIQYDDTQKQWYVQTSPISIDNTIYDGIVGIGTTLLGNQTGSTFVTRRVDNRGLDDRVYKLRYVIPKEFVNARPPTDGFVLQESKTTGITSASYLLSQLSDVIQLRNPKIITTASYAGGSANIKTELPHYLQVGDTVKISNVVSSNDSVESYNGSFVVQTVPNPREFSVGIGSDPGTFLNQVNQRSTQQQVEALPTIEKEKSRDTVFIYRSTEIKPLIPGAGGQDGIYNITVLSGSISPTKTIGFGISDRNFNQDVKNLFPQIDRDNYNSDPSPSVSYAELSPLGIVRTSDKKNSITKEALNYFFENNRVGYAITGAIVSGAGNTTVTIFTDIEHNLNSVKSVTLLNPGAGYNNNAGVTSTIYSSELLNASLPGKNASAKVVVSAANTIASVEIVDGGSAYAIGNTMSVSPDPAGPPTIYSFVQVSAINNNIGDSLDLSGFMEPTMNGTFKIVDVPSSRSVSILIENGVPSTNFRTRNDDRLPIAYLSAKGIGVSTITHNKVAGIATVICTEGHGLLSGNSFKLVGIGNTYFSKKFIVNETLGITSFSFYSGITTVTQTWNLTGVTIQKSAISANGRALGLGEENLGGRGNLLYVGVSTTLANPITSTDTSIVLTNANGFKKGDYISINSEIIRLVSDAASNVFSVIRGQFSTTASASETGSIVRKIRILPMEIRRPSILRASGHTFEYLGYGPGNYSTGLPVKQDRILSNEEVLVSQAREQDGGTVVYTGMNDRGEFYSGATKINGATGEEETIDAPVVTFFGDEGETVERRNSGVFDDLVVKERLTVEGGENNNQTSQFYGPVNFTQKLTSTADAGLETRDLYIKGVASQPKLLTVGIATPTEAKRSGDISFLATPDPGGFIGHIYADGDWRRWGMISQDKDRDYLKLDQIGVGQSSGIYNFSDAVEVNGTLKVKNLYVGGAVTFAGAQAIGNAAFDVIDLNSTIKFAGVGTNYTILTANANTIAQFQNLEVTGYAATFTTAKVTFGESFNSTYSGVSTVAGTLVVNNLVANTGVITAANMIVNNLNAGRLSVSTEAYITSGIITAIRTRYLGGLGNAGVGETVGQIMMNVGIITSLTGTACTITTINGTDAFITGVRANTALATPLATINTGIITNFKSTTAGITSVYVNTGIVTTLIVPSVGYLGATIDGWFGAPTAYVNTGFTTNSVITNYMSVPTGYINSGIITTLSGNASGATGGTLKYLNAQVGASLWLSGSSSGQGIFANAGIITNFGQSDKITLIHCGDGATGNPVGVVTAALFRSAIPTGTAPITVQSTTVCTNLNADLLDGRNSTYFFRGETNVWQTSDDSANRLYLATSGQTIFGSPANGYEFRGSSNTAIFTIDNTGNIAAAGEVTANSDERIKTNIKTIENALDKVTQLRGVEYDRTDIEAHQIGVIAQEVEKVLPDVVHTKEDGMKSVAYGNIVAVLIESIKELKGEISELRAELDELKGTK